MKNTKTLALISALAFLPAIADVEALYWQVTSAMNPDPIEFTAAAMVAAPDGGGAVVYLADSNGNEWQAANSDKHTTEAIASIWNDSYASGYTFYIELMNYSEEKGWYTAGMIDKGTGNWSYDDIKANIYSSSSMSMNLATPLATGSAHIPEPTSGLLMLVGGALLALRRRSSVKA